MVLLIKAKIENIFETTRDKEKCLLDDLNMAMFSAPVLAHFHLAKKTPLHAPGSGEGLGSVFIQHDVDGTNPASSYANRRLTDKETQSCSSDLELMALVWAVHKFHAYLYGRNYTVGTGNAALIWLQANNHLTLKLA